MTPEEAMAAGAVEDVPRVAPARPNVSRATSKPKVTREVPIVFGPGEKEKHEATVARLNSVAQGLGIDTDEQGQVLLDNDKSNAITHGYDPEAHTLNMRRYGLEMRKGEAAAKTGERSGIGEFFLGDKDYDPYKDLKGGLLSSPKTKALNDAQREWTLISQLVGHREEGKVGADPSTYLYGRDAAPSTKRETRERLATKILDEANTLPDAGGGAEIKAQFHKIADYIRTQDPALLHGAHKSMQEVANLAEHASPPVRDAVHAAIREQSDPERSSMLDAFKVGFGNNVAPMTMGAGSLVSQAISGPGGDVRAPGADVITRDPKTGLETTTRGAPSVGSGQTGRDVEQMHQRIVQNMTGKSPEEQAALIEGLKADHPNIYTMGAILGWFADPVGLLGSKAIEAAGMAGKALAGTGGKLAAQAAVGAPQGIVADLAGGGEGGVVPAVLGAGGAMAGEAVNAIAGKARGMIAGAPLRVEHGKFADAARAIDHEMKRAVHWGEMPEPKNHIKEVYRRLNAMIEPEQRKFLTLNEKTGRFKELEHAAEVGTHEAHAGATSDRQANAHAPTTLGNQDASWQQKAIAMAHETAIGREAQGLRALAIGSGRMLGGAADKGIAKLVAAIRAADPHHFRYAIREAREAGVTHEMIQAAEEAYHKRNHERVEADAP